MGVIYFLEFKKYNHQGKQQKKLFRNIEKEYEQHEGFFKDISNKIDAIYYPSQLEHMVVVDFLGAANNLQKIKEEGFIKPLDLNMNEALNKQIDKINAELDKKHYDGFTDKKQVKEDEKKQIDEKQYIASPFFKNFFDSVEGDFRALGIKENRLEEFYKRLDNDAKFLRIPSLPDNLEDLIKKTSIS